MPGSDGFGMVSSIVSISGKLILGGSFERHGPRQCGIFELDPPSGNVRTLMQGALGYCGGAISPDGKHAARAPENHLSIVDLDTGANHSIAGGFSRPTWSPDGRWIAAIHGKENSKSIVLIDPTDTRYRKNLGWTDDSEAIWSPDSKYLLVGKPQRGCGAFLWSLEIIDVATGKRSEVKSAHCEIRVSNTTGWLDSEVVKELP